MTIFSAPDYPQFQPANEDRFNNQGAVAVLRSSHDRFTSPEIVEYSAVPRPEVICFGTPSQWSMSPGAGLSAPLQRKHIT